MQVKETRADIELRVLDARDVAVSHSGGRPKSGKVVTAQNAPASHVPGLQVVAGSLSDAVVHEILEISGVLRPKDLPRVLIVEPFSSAVGDKLKAAGFTGELWALCSPTSSFFFQGQGGCAYDHVVMADWLSAAHDNRQRSSLGEIDQFDIVVMLEVARVAPHDQIAAMLRWSAGTLLAPYGYLVSAEPWEALSQTDLETKLLHSELLLAADERKIETDWSWRLSRWQLRPGDSSRLTGQISEITRTDLERNASVRQTLVGCYQEVFGGDEWGEWMRCPHCYRHYSFAEYEKLTPRGQCICGTDQSLDLYHAPESVLGELQLGLRDRVRSRLYVRGGPADDILAFIWGTLVTAEQIARDLVQYHGGVEQFRLRSALGALLEAQGNYDPSALILHICYLGAVKEARSLSLVRSLFSRMCQFAVDSRVDVVAVATIPTVNTYTLLRGIGMDIVYPYPSLPPQKRTSRLDESGVVLGGAARSLLAQVACSETRLALHIGRSTRRPAVSLEGD
jgi:hypothetical protein